MSATRRVKKKPFPTRTVALTSVGVIVVIAAASLGVAPKGISVFGTRLSFDTAQRPGGAVVGFATPPAGAKVSVEADGASPKVGIDTAASGCPGQAVTAFQSAAGGNGGPVEVTVGGANGSATGIRAVASASNCR